MNRIGKFEIGDVLVRIGELEKYVVTGRVQNGPSLVLDQVWFGGQRIVPRGTIITPKRQVQYVKVGRWIGTPMTEHEMEYINDIGHEKDDE